jgi:hypothetical protein
VPSLPVVPRRGPLSVRRSSVTFGRWPLVGARAGRILPSVERPRSLSHLRAFILRVSVAKSFSGWRPVPYVVSGFGN